MDAQTTPLSAVVADDEPEIRDLISEYLIKLGYQVTQAGDGLEALLHVRDRRPTLLILDLMMPRLGGIDALGHIRRTYPNVAIIVLTGTTDDALRGRVIGLGAATSLDSLEIQWPAPSGRKERIEKVPIDRYVRIVEGRGIVG